MPDGKPYPRQNFAPVKPLEDAKSTLRTGGSSSLSAIFREIKQEIQNDSEEAWREHIEMGRTISLFRAGKLIMKRDLSGAGYVFLKPLSGGRDRSNFPLFPQNSETLKAKWTKARPLVNARHFGDGYRAEIQTAEINRVIKNYFKDIFTPEYELNEALSAQDFGTYITQFFYDDQLNQIRQLSPILQNKKQVLMSGYGACYACPFEGAPEDFQTGALVPQCPKCGSHRLTKMIPETVADQQQIVDVEEITQGDITGALRPFPACKYDLRVLPQHSSYFRYQQFIPLRLAQRMCGELDIETAAGGGDSLGLQVMEALANRGGHLEGNGESNLYGAASGMRERAILTSDWIKPEWYAGQTLDRAEETVSGVIPAGVPLEEIFPNGVCVTDFNNGLLQIGIHAEKARVVGGVYFLQSFSGIGKGLSDSMDVAKDLNEIHSMAMAGLKRHGAAGIFYKKDAATPAQIRDLFKPNKAVPIDFNQAQITNINQAVGKIQLDPVNPALGAYMVQLSNLLNMATLTGDFTQGMNQDVDINTFGGQQLAHAKAEEQKGGILTMKVNHRERSAEEIIDLFREHIKLPRYFAASSDRHAATKGKWISGAELPENIKFDAVPDSEIPTNSFEKRQSAKEMVKEAGGLPALMQMAQADPKMTAWYVDQFGVELPNLDHDGIWITCLKRLDQIKQLSNVFADPEQIIEQLNLFVRESDHLLKADFLAQVLDDDEVAEWNPVAKGAVQLLIERHFEMQTASEVKNEAIKQRGMMALQAETSRMQSEMMQPMVDEQNQQMAQEKQEAVLGEVMNRTLDDEQTQIDHERGLEKDQANHARALELEELRAKNQPKQLKGK